jgi:hypothetical protein
MGKVTTQNYIIMNPRKEFTHLNNIVRSVNRRTGAHLSVTDARRIAAREQILVKERYFTSGHYPVVEGPLVRVIEAFLMEEAKQQGFTQGVETQPDQEAAPRNLSGYSDNDLVAELRRRGWDVTATRTETL